MRRLAVGRLTLCFLDSHKAVRHLALSIPGTVPLPALWFSTAATAATHVLSGVRVALPVRHGYKRTRQQPASGKRCDCECVPRRRRRRCSVCDTPATSAPSTAHFTAIYRARETRITIHACDKLNTIFAFLLFPVDASTSPNHRAP